MNKLVADDATKRTNTSAARRAQIVHAAIKTIAELGYDQASFARITERAGMSSPRMISYHFDSKDDLVHQIVHDVFDSGAEFIITRMRSQSSATGRLRAYLESNLEFLRQHPDEITALTEIGPHLRQKSGEPHTSVSAQEPSVQGLQELLREGQRLGEFRDFDPRSIAVMIRGAIDAAAPRVRHQSELDFHDYTTELVCVFTRATSKEGPR